MRKFLHRSCIELTFKSFFGSALPAVATLTALFLAQGAQAAPGALRSADITGTLSYDNVGVSPHPALAGPRAFAPIPPQTLLALIRALQKGELPAALSKTEAALLSAPASYPSGGVEYGAFFRARLIALVRGGHLKKAYALLDKLPSGGSAPLMPGAYVALAALSGNYSTICGDEAEYRAHMQGVADETRLFCAALFEKDGHKVGMLSNIVAEQYPKDAPVRVFSDMLATGETERAKEEWEKSLRARYFPAENQSSPPPPRPQTMPPGFREPFGSIVTRPAMAAMFFDKLYVYSSAEDAPLPPEDLFAWLHYFVARSLPLPDSLTVALQAENEKMGIAGDAPALLLLLYRMRSDPNPFEAVTLSREVRLLSRTGFSKAAKSLAEDFIAARPAARIPQPSRKP